MAQVTNFFVGANSGEGFRNLFSEMVNIEDTYDFMILKGGPGVGKNTFMREIGRTMEAAGTPVEYLWCSGDPDSLDGVVLPEIRCAVADGTSPHGSVSEGQRTSTVKTRRPVRREVRFKSGRRPEKDAKKKADSLEPDSAGAEGSYEIRRPRLKNYC